MSLEPYETEKAGTTLVDSLIRSALMESLFVVCVLTPLVWAALHHALLPAGQSVIEMILMGDDPIFSWTQVALAVFAVRGVFRWAT